MLIRMNRNPLDLNFLCSGKWLFYNGRNRKDNNQIKTLIATITWIIWKERCNHIFKNNQPNLGSILSRAYTYCENFYIANGNNNREYSIPSQSYKSIFFFTDASWNSFSENKGLGFLIITNSGMVLLAGSLGTNYSSPLNAEIDAICMGLQLCKDNNWKPKKSAMIVQGSLSYANTFTPASLGDQASRSRN